MMTPAQRKLYHGRLWPAACQTQGWNPTDAHQRQRVTFGATGETSTSDLDQAQITLLFNKLAWLADPQNFDKALADSDPAQALAENRRKQITWRIEQAAAKIPGDPAKYLSELAASRHGTSNWQTLPTPELLRFSMTIASRTTTPARARRAQNRPANPVQDPCIALAAAPEPRR